MVPLITRKLYVEISKTRDGVWSIFADRAHYVNRVYAIDDSGLDLTLVGSVSMDLKNGAHLDLPFAVRLTIDEASFKAGSPRINLFQVFTVGKLCRLPTVGTWLLMATSLGLLQSGQGEWEEDRVVPPGAGSFKGSALSVTI